MLIDKITVGFVIQTFDTETGEYASQSFVAGDDVSYEVDGKPLTPGHGLGATPEPYLPFDMRQPGPNEAAIVDNSDLLDALIVVHDLATQNQLDESVVAGDPDLAECAEQQNDALELACQFIEQAKQANPLTAYQQVINDLAAETKDDPEALPHYKDNLMRQLDAFPAKFISCDPARLNQPDGERGVILSIEANGTVIDIALDNSDSYDLLNELHDCLSKHEEEENSKHEEEENEENNG